ncbi:MAG: hypothetical protein EBU44_03325, partial [Proteobacteria bacterium]|nr:hypothetical protein [Pseudomonadota bacterium]
SDQTALYNKFNLLTTSGTYSIDPGDYTADFTTSGFTGSGAGFAVVANSGISGTTGSWTAASSSSGKVVFGTSSVNTYGGSTTVYGATLQLANSNTTIPAGNTIVVSGGTFDINGQRPSYGSVTVSAGSIIDSAVSKGTIAATAFNMTPGNAVTATISAVMIDAAGGARVLTVSGTGLSVANASNTFTGGVVLNSGIFAPGSVNSLGSGFTDLNGAAGTITFSGGAVRLYENTNSGADALYARFKTPVSNSYKIDVPSGYSVAFTSPFVGTSGVGFEKLGDGTLTFNNTETYTGSYSCYPTALSVTAEFRMGAYSQTIGAVTVGNGSVTSTTGILTSTSGFTLNPSTGGTANVSAILAGSVNLTQSGGGTGILSGVNTYTGITTISGGVLQISQDANLGAVPGTVTATSITFNGGTLQITSGFTLNTNRGITLSSGGGNILVDSGQTLTYA